MTETPTQPYEELAALIEKELELVAARRFDELETVTRARADLQSSLPAVPPETARAELERCALLHRRVHIELQRVREAVLVELADVRQAQRAAKGYAPMRAGGRRVSAQA
ncbi:MAG TPA: hypothetical protein VG371_17170 [Solirubrobacteraceae bacterium]|jgi:hypothetical protein|nr:hypothetical protein [Solirubrobacteraceae bacterium]